MAQHVKLALTVIVGLGILLSVLTLFIGPAWDDVPFNLLICCTGIALGWVAGLISSPLDKVEKSRFSAATKILSAFVSGYILSKLDTYLEIIKGKNVVFNELLLGRGLFLLCFAVFAALTVYYLRSYDARQDPTE